MRNIFAYVLLALFGCAGGSSITSTTPNKPDKEIKKVLVVVLSPIPENRTTAEEETVYWLRHNKYNAFASVDYLKAEKKLPTADEVKKVLDEIEFDGIVTLRLKDVDEDTRYVTSSQAQTVMISQTYFYNYLNAWNAYYVPGYYATAKSLEVETRIFEESNEQVLYSATSENVESSNIEYTISEIAQNVVQNIKSSKVLTASKRK